MAIPAPLVVGLPAPLALPALSKSSITALRRPLVGGRKTGPTRLVKEVLLDFPEVGFGDKGAGFGRADRLPAQRRGGSGSVDGGNPPSALIRGGESARKGFSFG